MIEMRDDPRHPKDDKNTKPLYCACWERYVWKDGEIVMKDGKAQTKTIGSGWRSDQADTAALAMRMNGYIVRGYFAGML